MKELASETMLAELLCARLCHDLAGPLGATAAGSELLAEGWDEEAAQMVATSASAAVGRLKLLRAAFGPPLSDQPGASLKALSEGFLDASAISSGSPIRLTWDCARAGIDGRVARLLLNLVILGRDALGRGGTLAVSVAQTPAPGGLGLSVSFHGPGAALPDEMVACLLGNAPAKGPRGAQAWFTRRIAQEMGFTPRLVPAPDGGVMMI